jgi:outer membrane protein assembly factor BamB
VAVDAFGRWVLVQLAPAACDATENELVVFDASNGHARWRASMAAGPPSKFAVTGRVVALKTADGVVKAVDLATGVSRWQATGFASGRNDEEIVATGDLFVAQRGTSSQTHTAGHSNGPPTLVALERTNGNQRWTYLPDSHEQVLGLIFDGQHATMQAAVTADSPAPSEPVQKLVGLDLATGAPTWTTALGAWEGSSPIVTVTGTVFFTGSTSAEESRQLPGAFESGARTVALDAGSGAILWDHHDNASEASTSMVAADATLYTTKLDGSLTALDARTGVTRWTRKVPAATGLGGMSAATAGNGLVVSVHRTRTTTRVDALETDTGHVRWTSKTPIWTARIAAGSVFLTGSGTVSNCD